MAPPGSGGGAAAAAAALPGNDPPSSPASRATNGGGYAYESRVLMALFLASALMFFLTYQLFGAAAATAVVVLFLAFALAAHRVRVSRGFPFLHLSTRSPPAAAGAGGRRRWSSRPPPAARTAGMDAAAISALPAAFAYKRETTGWAQCAICLGLVAIGDAARRLPTCGHLFHAGCIDRWLRAHATCPVCRAAVGAAATVPELPPV